MGLVVKFPIQMEDRMNVALRDFNARTNWAIILSDKPEDVTSNYNNSQNKVEYYFNIKAKVINKFLHFLEDCENIMGIPITFRYCNSKKEAYISADEYEPSYQHLWLRIHKEL